MNEDYSNRTHQLLVTVSRHLYISKDGVVKYQEKPLGVDIKNFHCSSKEHLVYYILRDVFSGNFIFSLATTRSMLPLLDFLYFGWKKESHFWGLPQNLSVPKRIASLELLTGLHRLGVETFHPASGFASGIRIIADLEDNLCYYVLIDSALHSFNTLEENMASVYRHMLEGTGDLDRRELWQTGLPPGHPRKVPDYPSFIALFPTPEDKKPGLPLLGSTKKRKAAKKSPLPDFLKTPIEDVKFSKEKLERAREVLNKTDDTVSRSRLLQIAYEALGHSPYCVDAYILLAQESRYPEERTALCQRAVKAGELALGELFFRRNVGNFWRIIETRPYMRALSGLADCLWEDDQPEKALEILREMLRLNPNDNQGVRYQLGCFLIKQGLYDEMESLFIDYEEESCFMLYNLALAQFLSGATRAKNSLCRALRTNKYVSSYLLGEKVVPRRPPDYYSRGSEQEAVIYACMAGDSWHKFPEALDWLAHQRSILQKSVPVSAADPSIARLLQEFIKDQGQKVGEKTLNKYKSALELLQAYLESYGLNLLDDDEERQFEAYLKQDNAEKEYSFSHYFGPDKIPGATGEFLGYFMVRKVSCGKDQLAATGTAIKKLARWLAARQYITAADGDEMVSKGSRAHRELPVADKLTEMLFELAQAYSPVAGDEVREDMFLVQKVEPGKLYLELMGGEGPLEVAVPKEVSRLCQVGWQISLLLVKTKKGWRISGCGNVYPL